MLKKNIVEEDFADFNYIVFEGPKQDYNENYDCARNAAYDGAKKMLLVKYSGVFAKASEEAKTFWAAALKTVPDYAVIAFYEEEVDKRSVLYKAAAKAGEAVECAYLEGVELINWVGRGCRRSG